MCGLVRPASIWYWCSSLKTRYLTSWYSEGLCSPLLSFFNFNPPYVRWISGLLSTWKPVTFVRALLSAKDCFTMYFRERKFNFECLEPFFCLSSSRTGKIEIPFGRTKYFFVWKPKEISSITSSMVQVWLLLLSKRCTYWWVFGSIFYLILGVKTTISWPLKC